MSENRATHPVKHGIKKRKWNNAGMSINDPLNATIAVENGKIVTQPKTYLEKILDG